MLITGSIVVRSVLLSQRAAKKGRRTPAAIALHLVHLARDGRDGLACAHWVGHRAEWSKVIKVIKAWDPGDSPLAFFACCGLCSQVNARAPAPPYAGNRITEPRTPRCTMTGTLSGCRGGREGSGGAMTIQGGSSFAVRLGMAWEQSERTVA